MATFDVTIACKVPAYVIIEVEAATLEDANAEGNRIVAQCQAAPEMRGRVLHFVEPERAATDFELHSVLPAEEYEVEGA